MGTPAEGPSGRGAIRCRVGVERRFLGGGTGPLKAGREKFGVRWKTVSSAACCAMIGIDWIPDDPVPMTATRLPEKSTPPWGQRPV